MIDKVGDIVISYFIINGHNNLKEDVKDYIKI